MCVCFGGKSYLRHLYALVPMLDTAVRAGGVGGGGSLQLALRRGVLLSVPRCCLPHYVSEAAHLHSLVRCCSCFVFLHQTYYQ